MPDDDCDCEFDWPELDDEESWHYRRTCPECGTEWGSLHCQHDGVQNPCPGCGWIEPGKRLAGAVTGLPLDLPPGQHPFDWYLSVLMSVLGHEKTTIYLGARDEPPPCT